MKSACVMKNGPASSASAIRFIQELLKLSVPKAPGLAAGLERGDHEH